MSMSPFRAVVLLPGDSSFLGCCLIVGRPLRFGRMPSSRQICREWMRNRSEKQDGRLGRGIMGDIITLKDNRDFRRLYYRGKSYASPVLVTYVLKNRRADVRIGITTGKKIGKAVMRNRSRRIIREAFRALSGSIRNGYDFVFVARTKTPFVKSYDVMKAMKKQLKDAGVLT